MIAENCWKFMKCPNSMKQNCDVYLQGYGKECWLIPKGAMKGWQKVPLIFVFSILTILSV